MQLTLFGKPSPPEKKAETFYNPTTLKHVDLEKYITEKHPVQRIVYHGQRMVFKHSVMGIPTSVREYAIVLKGGMEISNITKTMFKKFNVPIIKKPKRF